ncbi:MAG: DUF1080 domain-containing protein [Fuerstiella sp.]|nr:DUF1080 domain-containing protein [Fuerstiella sp.]
MRTTILCGCLILSGVTGANCQAHDQSAEILDVEHADADFAIQGEYSGTIEVNGNEVKFGVQIIADGAGKFRSVEYSGGLPGNGWDGSDQTKVPGSAEVIDGVCLLKANNGEGRGEIKNGILKLLSDGKELGKLKKVKRESPTLGAKAPKCAVVLFDGTNADNFVEDGLLENNLLKQGATSRQKFGSYNLHMEFLLSYSPKARGQRRSNSGCYHQGRYEVQILDSFGLEGVDHECGGIYKIASPAVNMCFPPLSWQTYDVEFHAAIYDSAGQKTKNAWITVLHNGVKIHDRQELGHATTAYTVAEGPEDGPIYLQDHSNQVRFRNIWVQPLK